MTIILSTSTTTLKLHDPNPEEGTTEGMFPLEVSGAECWSGEIPLSGFPHEEGLDEWGNPGIVLTDPRFYPAKFDEGANTPSVEEYESVWGKSLAEAEAFAEGIDWGSVNPQPYKTRGASYTSSDGAGTRGGAVRTGFVVTVNEYSFGVPAERLGMSLRYKVTNVEAAKAAARQAFLDTVPGFMTLNRFIDQQVSRRRKQHFEAEDNRLGKLEAELAAELLQKWSKFFN